jgi:predicted small secreted protein
MISLKDDFQRVETGAPAHFRNLTLLPLLRRNVESGDPGYLVLDEAIEQGYATLRELDRGSVSEIELVNRAERPVLLVDGQELVGAKQNRVLNLTILAPAKSKLRIPVSCVEAGRWTGSSPYFKPAERVMYPAVRAVRAEHVTRSMRETGSRRSDQHAVWGHIALRMAHMQVHSDTEAMAEIFESHSVSIEEYVRAFQWQDGQAGIVFAIDSHPLGLDLFDHPLTLRKLFPALLRSYALDALNCGRETCEPASPETMSDLLAKTAAAPTFCDTAVGLGKDVRLFGPAIRGAALWAEERYIHVCSFVHNDTGPADGGSLRLRLSRPVFRRRHRR